MNFLKKLKDFIFGNRNIEKINEINELETVSDICDWAVNRIDSLHGEDANAIISEFSEWINISDQTEELEYFYIENQGWTEDQEIDVR